MSVLTPNPNIGNCKLFLGFEYFSANYFSDLSILTQIISLI